MRRELGLHSVRLLLLQLRGKRSCGSKATGKWETELGGGRSGEDGLGGNRLVCCCLLAGKGEKGKCWVSVLEKERGRWFGEG